MSSGAYHQINRSLCGTVRMMEAAANHHTPGNSFMHKLIRDKPLHTGRIMSASPPSHSNTHSLSRQTNHFQNTRQGNSAVYFHTTLLVDRLSECCCRAVAIAAVTRRLSCRYPSHIVVSSSCMFSQ